MREALETGELPERRWESYLKLQREARRMAMRHDARLKAEEKARWKRMTKEYREHGAQPPLTLQTAWRRHDHRPACRCSNDTLADRLRLGAI